jgi:chromate transporter
MESTAIKTKGLYTLWDLVLYFLKLGALGFGGPIALLGYMHRDLVENRKWITNDDYKDGVALAQLAPGPLAAQLAIYIGYIDYGILGATVAGLAFILPSFLIILILGFVYTRYGVLSWIQAVFYGVGAAVIGIISVSSYKLAKKTLGKDWILWGLFLLLGITTFLTERENLWLLLLSGLVVWLLRVRPKNTTKIKACLFVPFFLHVNGSFLIDSKLSQSAWFFLKAGAFVFGSGLAIVPFLYGGVVKEHQWLNEQQFLDAVAIAMITPGPVVITVAFIGYLIAGIPGACIAALATFLPCYLFTIIPAPYFKKYGQYRSVKAIVDGITAAAVGAIAGAVLILTKRQLVDWITVFIAIITALALLRFKKMPEPAIIIIAAIAGLLLKS